MAAKKKSTKKASVRKSPAKKAPARKTTAKKASTRKTTARKSPAKKASAKKASTRKTTARKASTRKAPARKAPARNSTGSSMANRWFASNGFDDILEWEGKGGISGQIPLLDGPYHSKSKDISEACAEKKNGFYVRVWRANADGRQEICLKK